MAKKELLSDDMMGKVNGGVSRGASYVAFCRTCFFEKVFANEAGAMEFIAAHSCPDCQAQLELIRPNGM